MSEGQRREARIRIGVARRDADILRRRVDGERVCAETGETLRYISINKPK
jgi:hypothetical protein